MYDRKTWIVLAICGVLLAINYTQMQKNARIEMEHRAQEQKVAAEKAAIEQEAGKSTKSPDSADVAEGVKTVDAEPVKPIEPASTYELQTDKVKYTLTSLGGGIQSAELLSYPRVEDHSQNVLINLGANSAIGTLSLGIDQLEYLNYQLLSDESVEGEKIAFAATHPSGIEVKKTWSLVPSEEPGAGYQLDFDLQLRNPKDAAIQGNAGNFSIFLGRAQPLQAGESRINPSNYLWRSKGKFKHKRSTSLQGSKIKKSKSVVTKDLGQLEYTGVSNQFFATILRNKELMDGGIWAKAVQVDVPGSKKTEYAVRAGMELPEAALIPGEIKNFHFRLYTGPKDNGLLRAIGDNMGDIMAYGWPIFSYPARFMNFLLGHTYKLISGFSGKWAWGISVILVTLIVRGLMWPLYARSNRTMQRMSKLKPEMDKLKEKYPDEPAKVQQEIMGLYRKYGINPVGGCLPMFAQMPIFFGFFRMLQHAVEMRGSEFLWVQDLSMPDTVATIGGIPINVLPIIMGVSSFLQMHLTPQAATTDKMQARMMKLMPLMFLFFCYNYGAALALYWTTSNIFSIVQVWATRKLPEPKLRERQLKKRSGKSFMERMAEAAEEAQKKQQHMRKAKGRVVQPKEKQEPRKQRPPRTGG